MKILVSSINIYPFKSTSAVELASSKLTRKGLRDDRCMMFVDENGIAISARECQVLLKLKVIIQNQDILFSYGEEVFQARLPPDHSKKISVKIFSSTTNATLVSDKASQWLSSILKVNGQLVYMSDQDKRIVPKKAGGQSGDVVSFADENPLLLISEESLADLNSRLKQAVTIHHFRPNIVVKGVNAFDEDSWHKIQIGKNIFRVAQACKRCILTTIDPKSTLVDENREPLKTLTQYRYNPEKNGATFGVHLIPEQIDGEIAVDNEVSVLS